MVVCVVVVEVAGRYLDFWVRDGVDVVVDVVVFVVRVEDFVEVVIVDIGGCDIGPDWLIPMVFGFGFVGFVLGVIVSVAVGIDLFVVGCCYLVVGVVVAFVVFVVVGYVGCCC